MSPALSPASWLLAAPQTTRAGRIDATSSVMTPPMAQGREDVGGRGEDRVRGDGLRPEGRGGLRRACRVDITDQKLRACRANNLRQVPAHMAETLYGHGAPGQITAAEAPLGRDAHGVEDPARRAGRRIAGRVGPVGKARDEARFPPHDLHVGGRHAHVLGGPVAPAQRLDRAAHRAELGLRLLGRASEDHRLAAAKRQIGRRGLQRHAPRQRQHIGQRGVLAVVGAHPQATGRGSARRGMDRDETGEARRGVRDAQDGVMGGDGQRLDLHGARSFRSGWRCPELSLSRMASFAKFRRTPSPD